MINTVILQGRLTKDIELKYTATTQKAVCRFNLAVDRNYSKEKQADFPSCIAFDKTAEFLADYFHKGDMLGLEGSINTGSYEKDGKKVYTTDVIVNRVHFMGGTKKETSQDDVPSGFTAVDEDVPF